MSAGLGFTRLSPDESYRHTVTRYATKYGLAAECLAVFDREVAAGENEEMAAWYALYEWDVLDLIEEPPEQST